MGGPSRTHGNEDKCIEAFCQSTWRKGPRGWRIILKRDLQRCVKAWTGVVWAKVGTSFGLL